ncbi:MAG TPA: glycosyltransferase family 4 protein [Flavobacteriales bacterium]|nr:glycosyltransferase family 4 protein [Flavobacteriales bacterium]
MQVAPHITVMTGPGNHSEKLVDAIKLYGVPVEVFRYFPDFTHEFYDHKGLLIKTSKPKITPQIARFAWAFCIRIPFLKKRNYHVYLHFLLYDSWVKKRASSSSKLLWAWSQTSLQTMKKFKKQKKHIVLEKPMIHVLSWTTILQQAYKCRFHAYYFSRSLQKRMLQEYEKAEKIIVLSDFASNSFVQNGIESEKLTKLNLYVNTNLFKPAGAEPEGTFNILFVGRIDTLKGAGVLLDAFERLNTKHPDISLTLVGANSYELQNRLMEKKENIRITGYKTPGELASYYQQAHLLVLPSAQESFGLVMLEALACETPVLASVKSGGPDLEKLTTDVKTVDPSNAFEIDNALLFFYNNRSRAKKTFSMFEKYNKDYYLTQVNTVIKNYL